MIDSIQIVGFKGFGDVEVKDFAPVNLIVGDNNVGKTAFLEAVFLVAGAGSPTTEMLALRNPNASTPKERQIEEWTRWVVKSGQSWARIIAKSARNSRGVAFGTSMESLELCGLGAAGTGQSLGKVFRRRLRLNDDDVEKVGCISSSVAAKERINQLFELVAISPSAEASVVDWVKLIDPRTLDMRSLQLSPGSDRQVYVGVGEQERIPLTHLGQGANRLLYIALRALESKRGGVLLIDEIDSGLHHSFLPKFWSAIFRLVRDQQLQLFCTTHSYECIEAAALAAQKSEGNDLAFIRLDRQNGRVSAVVGNERKLQAAVAAGFEVR